MRVILSLLLFGFAENILAQDADFRDYRRKTENFSRIYDKEIRSDLASFSIAGIAESLNKTPLKQLPATDAGDNYIVYDSNRIKVIIRSGRFEASKHKLTYENKRVVKIDGQPYYGDYTRIPATSIQTLTVIMDADTIPVPIHAIDDLYDPEFIFTDASGQVRSQDAVYLSRDKRKLYIYMLKKDDTGGYEVTWIIQDKKYLRRVLDFNFLK